MDGRDAMAYYMQRGMAGPGSGAQPALIPASAGMHGAFGGPGHPLQPHAGGGSNVGGMYSVEGPVSGHGVNVGSSSAVPTVEQPVKRKRGRPRKYGTDGSVALALPSPISSSSPHAAVGGSPSSTLKRGRGRPPGSGKKQQLASLGEWMVGSAGMGFTPHVVTISPGEDVAAKIMSFSQQGPRAICILSANGVVSTVTLSQPASSGGSITYEGRFEILCLSGCYLLSDSGGSHGRTGGLSVSLSGPDGRVIGGGVGGLLIAASLVQVIVGSFTYTGAKPKNKSKAGSEVVVEGETTDIDKFSTAISGSHNLSASPLIGSWASSRPTDPRNPNVDIDLTRG